MASTSIRRRRNSLLCAAAALSPLVLAWAAHPLLLRDAFPVCIFRIATGLPCPFCGLTRAVACATHGQWRSAWHYNSLWLPVSGILVMTAASFIYDALTNSNATGGYLMRVLSAWRWLISALALFGLVRIVSGWY